MENTEEYLINVENLTKKFGDFIALENLNLKIKKGTIFGLVGPNGSGKTTAIQCVLGLYDFERTSSIKVSGLKVPNDISLIYRKIGYMPQDISLYSDLSIEKNLKFFGALKKIPKAKLNEKIDELLKLVELEEFRSRIISKCSGGMQRRTSLACALLSDPEILILDEPTVGIDPELRVQFWDYFRKLAKHKGTTFLITTHYLGESVRCDEIGLIRKRLIIKGKPEELRKIVQKNRNLPNLPDMDTVFIHFTKEKHMEAEI
jgi:ABC-2 type transport system ATP-binding protein